MSRPTRPLRIAVADDEPDTRQFFGELLAHLGHEVVAAAADGRELVRQCRGLRPDLVITDVKMPDLDGFQAAAEVNRQAPVPVILVSGHHDLDLLAHAGADYIMAFLSKPAKPVDLQAAIDLALLRFEHFEALRREAADLRQALEERKLIERAKGILMKRAGLDEPAAFRRLQKLASDKNRRLAEVAQIILTAEEAFQVPENGTPAGADHVRAGAPPRR